MNWPKYREINTFHISTNHLFEVITNFALITGAIKVFIIILVYVEGVQFSVPFADAAKMKVLVEQSHILTVIDAFFTGGALANVSPFALGILPLMLLFGSYTDSSTGRLRIEPRITRKSILLIGALSAFLIVWLAYNNVIPSNLSTILISTTILGLGSIILLKLNNYLALLCNVELLSVNLILVGISYIVQVKLANNGDLILIGFMILFALHFTYISQKGENVQIFNIKKLNEVREGNLSLTASNSLLRQSTLFFIVVLTLIFTALVNFAFETKVVLFGNSYVEIFSLIASTFCVVFLGSTNTIFGSFLSQFNASYVAKILINDYWVIPNVQIGKQTASYLQLRATHLFRLTYYFYLVWVTFLSIIVIGLTSLDIPYTPLPFGVLGILLILNTIVELGYQFVTAFLNFIRRVTLKEFWGIVGISGVQEIEIVTPRDFEELQNIFYSHLTQAEQLALTKRAQELLNSDNLPVRDIAQIIYNSIRLYRRPRVLSVEKQRKLIYFKLTLCTSITLAIGTIAVLAISIAIQEITTEIRVVTVLSMISTQFSLMGLVGLGQDFRGLWQKMKSGANQRSGDTLEPQGDEKEMEPITAMIVGALVSGAAAGLSSTVEGAITDAYAGLKNLIINRYGQQQNLVAAVQAVEAEPNSSQHKVLLAHELEATGAVRDSAIVDAANSVRLVASVHNTRAKILSSRLELKLKQVEAVERQIDTTIEAGQKVVLQTQRDDLWDEINKLEEQVSNSLGG